MDSLKVILFKKYYIREILTLFFIVSSLLFMSIFTSFALFEKSVEKVGIASITVSKLDISLSTKSITVAAGETVFEDIVVTNNSNINVRYKLYATNVSDSVTIGISSASENAETGILSANGTEEFQKTVRVGIKNDSTSNVTITIGVQGGYVYNAVVISGGTEFSNVLEETLYPIFADTSGANEPILADGMIPVVYDETYDTWIVADTEQGWYAYQDQIWANAVTVTSTNRSTYMNAEPGTSIPMDDINSMWVWIPRFKYNIPSNIGSSEAVITPPQINVQFITTDDTDNATEATYRTGIADDGTNTNYYIHPAFRNIDNITYDSSTASRGAWDEEITGFWVGKFKTATDNDACNSASSDTAIESCKDVNPIIKPDVVALSNQSVGTQFLTSLKFSGGTMDETTGEVTFAINADNIYGLNTNTNTTDTHMMKNTEWGAVAILSQSQYGKMGNIDYTDTNKEIYKNNSSLFYTGRSSGTPSSSGSTTYGTYSYNNKSCSSNICTGEETANTGTGSSTTGTIYGVYDMSGGSYEETMGNWNSTIQSSEFSVLPTSKYYDYYTGTSSTSITKDKAILGDGTWETMNWYSDNPGFAINNYPWFIRSGHSNGSETVGIWYSYYSDGSANSDRSWRATLIP